MNIHYLNTDLELESPKDLTPIVKEFDDDAKNLYNGRGRGHYLATFEMPGYGHGPDTIIQHFCMLAEALEGDEKELWDGCFKKIFDIGYECGDDPKSFSDEIREGTLERVAALGACIRITVYPGYEKTSEQESA